MEIDNTELNGFMKAEEEFYNRVDGYTSEQIEQHRRFFTIEERMALLVPSNRRTEDQNKFYNDAWKKVFTAQETDPVYQESKDKKVLAIMRHVYGNVLREVLQGKSDEYPEFREVKITKEAYDKANAIAKRVVEVSNSPNEIYFYMLNEKKNDDVKITDVYVPHQRVDPSFCKTVLGSGLLADEKRIYEEGKKLSAWGHSHGHYGVFHSPMDAENFENVPGMYGTKRIVRLSCFSGSPPAEFEVNVMPSLVFNARGDRPFVEIVSEYHDFRGYNYQIERNKKPLLEILNEANNVSINIDEIDRSIWERVQPHTGFRRDFEMRMRSALERAVEQKVETSDLEITEQSDEVKEGFIRLSTREYLELLKGHYRLTYRVQNLESRMKNLEDRLG
ncbi:MAG: hypothetical protein Q7S74_02610 [Nanoarchaeota archaeon]|nr:hypothetical protein [Nanoarchaeota archaeon]